MKILETIANLIWVNGEPTGKEEIKQSEKIKDFLDTVKDSYVLIDFPDVQEYMEEDWFDEEAIPSNDSSYFIPITRLFE